MHTENMIDQCLAMVDASWFLMGMSSTHFVKWSITVRIYTLLFE